MKRIIIEEPTPIYDEKGNIKYYQDDEYIYIPHKSKKQEWSEEGENKIESIKGLITMGRFADTNTIRTIWNLLDSLRPHWKPSEECCGAKGDPDPAGVQAEKDVEKYPKDKSFEDEWKDYYNNSLVSRLPMNKRGVAKHFYWFAKKNAWKPSEEQIKAIESCFCEFGEGCPDEDGLRSLYNDLKKLM